MPDAVDAPCLSDGVGDDAAQIAQCDQIGDVAILGVGLAGQVSG